MARPLNRRRDIAATLFMMMYSKETGERRKRTLARAAIDAGLTDLPANPSESELDTVIQRLMRAYAKFVNK